MTFNGRNAHAITNNQEVIRRGGQRSAHVSSYWPIFQEVFSSMQGMMLLADGQVCEKARLHTVSQKTPAYFLANCCSEALQQFSCCDGCIVCTLILLPSVTFVYCNKTATAKITRIFVKYPGDQSFCMVSLKGVPSIFSLHFLHIILRPNF